MVKRLTTASGAMPRITVSKASTKSRKPGPDSTRVVSGAVSVLGPASALPTRKIASVAETVSEEQARDTVAAIVLVHVEDALGIELGANDHVVVKMDTAFGGAGAARRVEPERGIVFAGGLGGEIGRGLVEQVAEI